MGKVRRMFLERLIRKSKASEIREYISSHLLRTETTDYRRLNEGQRLIALMMASPYVGICSSLNAQVCSQCQIRLYRKATPSAQKRGYAITKKARPELFDRRLVGKAAEYANYAEEIEEVTDHEVLGLLDRPNPWLSGLDADYLRFRQQEITGNAFLYVVRESGRPVHLIPLFAQYVTPIGDSDKYLDGYVYSRSREVEEKFAPDQILHFRFAPSLDDPFLGDGPLHNLTQTVAVQEAANQVEIARFKNGGRPDLWIHLQGASKEQRDQFRDDFNSTHAGPNQAGKLFVSAAKNADKTSVQLFPLGTTNRDMEYPELQARADRIIWNGFGVPETLLMLSESNLASSSTGHAQYGRITVQPRLVRDAGNMTDLLLPLYGITPGDMWFMYDPVVEDDVEAQANTSRADVQAGIITVNEARAIRGLDPSEDENADKLMIGGTPLGEAPAGPMIGNTPIAGLFGRSAEEVTDTTAIETKVVTWNPLDILKAGEELGAITPEIERQVYENFRKELAKLYGAQNVSSMLEAIERGGGLGEFQKELERILDRHINVAVEAGIASIEREIDLSDPERFRRRRPVDTIEYLQGYRVQLAQDITSNLELRLRTAVASGIDEGVPVADIADRIQAAWPEASEYQVERIARTETQQGFNGGRVAGFEKAGITQKRWKLAPGACPVCHAIFNGVGGIEKAGKTPHDLNEPFATAGETISLGGRTHTFKRDVQFAPAHVGCRCGIGPVFGDEQ